jgi:hypothetical protein
MCFVLIALVSWPQSCQTQYSKKAISLRVIKVYSSLDLVRFSLDICRVTHCDLRTSGLSGPIRSTRRGKFSDPLIQPELFPILGESAPVEKHDHLTSLPITRTSAYHMMWGATAGYGSGFLLSRIGLLGLRSVYD